MNKLASHSPLLSSQGARLSDWTGTAPHPATWGCLYRLPAAKAQVPSSVKEKASGQSRAHPPKSRVSAFLGSPKCVTMST